MKPKIIRSGKTLNKKFRDKMVMDLLDTNDWPYFSLALVKKTTNDIKAGYDKESNVVYYVLKGSATCVLDNKKYKVGQGDMIISPKGTVYKNLKGTLLLAISTPRYDRTKRVYVK